MAKDNWCYLAVVVATVGIVVWGFMEVLKKRQPDETDELSTISRQIRGFGYLMLATIVLSIGAGSCDAISKLL